MDRILNALTTGGKTLLISLVGSVLTALLLVLKDVHLTGLAGTLWGVAGFAITTAIIKAVMRAIGYDPNKDPNAAGPLVPLSAVPSAVQPAVMANIKK